MSDLIEQLGGYEAAKAQGEKWGFDDFLNNQLLEYRRQHNIFEVGDTIKAKDYHFGFDELFRIDDFYTNDDGVICAVLDDGDCYPLCFIEHATDAEIEAGKRLKVKA